MIRFFVAFLMILIAVQAYRGSQNTETSFPGFKADTGSAPQTSISTVMGAESDNVANRLSERQRTLYERGPKKQAGPPVPAFGNLEAVFPSQGLDFLAGHH